MVIASEVVWWHDCCMTGQKAMTIRLSAEQAEALETVASVENQPVSEVIRAAIASHIESVSKDETFPGRLA